MKWFLLVVLALVLSGCPDNCDKGETRCSGNIVEICDSSHDWEQMMDCDDIQGGGPWECCADPIEGGFNCLNPPECGKDQ
jgi:hypothetical protein